MKNSKKTKKLLAALSCLAMITNVETTQNNRIYAMLDSEEEEEPGKKAEENNGEDGIPLYNGPFIEEKKEEKKEDEKNEEEKEIQPPSDNNNKNPIIQKNDKNKESGNGIPPKNNEPTNTQENKNNTNATITKEEQLNTDIESKNLGTELIQIAKLWETGEKLSRKLPPCFKTKVIYNGDKNPETEDKIQKALGLENLLPCEIVPLHETQLDGIVWTNDSISDTNIVIFWGNCANVSESVYAMNEATTRPSTWTTPIWGQWRCSQTDYTQPCGPTNLRRKKRMKKIRTKPPKKMRKLTHSTRKSREH